MKVNDFEKAIDALSTDIVIDEMKIWHSKVIQVNAHTNNQLVVWDECGWTYSADKDGERKIFLTIGEDGNIFGLSGVPVDRDKSYDLKFE